MRPPWIGTSWKMNKTRADARRWCDTVKGSRFARDRDAVQLFVVPPATLLADVAGHLAETTFLVGAQTMHWADAGAWTGEISAPMIKDCGATLVELGHSERREHFGENDEALALKVAQALRYGLVPLLCVGDTHAEFGTGQTAAALRRQVTAGLSGIDRAERGRVVIAYEPVWSIGEKGTPAEPGFVDEQHRLLKDLTAEIAGAPLRILYGGSVNPDNCVALASRPMVDGLFIGRSAWEATSYLGIVDRVIAALGG